MKYLIIYVLIFVSVGLYSFPAASQKTVTTPNNNFDSVEVFVSITAHNDVVYNDVKALLNNLNGVKYLAYCPNHAVFMVYIDKNIYATNNDFKNRLLKSLYQYTKLLDLKTGAFKDFKLFCAANEAESAVLKTKFGE